MSQILAENPSNKRASLILRQAFWQQGGVNRDICRQNFGRARGEAKRAQVAIGHLEFGGCE
jgi:hypothetical protein